MTQRRLYHIQGLRAWISQAAREPRESPGVTRLEWSSSFSDSLFRIGTKPPTTADPANCIGIATPFPMHSYTLLLTLRASVPSIIKMNLSFHRYRLMDSITSHQPRCVFVPNACLPKVGRLLRSQGQQTAKVKTKCTHITMQICMHKTCITMQICMHTGMALARETRGLPKLGYTPSQEQSLLLSWGTLFSVHAYRSSPGRQCPIKPPLNVGLYLLDRKVYFQCLFLCVGLFVVSEDQGRMDNGRCN